MLTPTAKNLLSLTLLVALTTPAHAGWFGKKEEKKEQVQTEALNNVLNLTLPADQEAAQRAALQVLADQMVPRLNETQRLLNEEQTEAALSLAKSTLDEVRIKTGIDPKAKLRENFLVATVFSEGASSMSALPTAQQQMVIRTVKDFRGGLYLDILNLTKRTTLLYIKALHQQIKKDGGLNQEDRSKIFRDLVLATVVPMPIQDKSGNIITVFDEEVANEDHTYLFNRELKMYLLSAQDLQISEKSFIEYREKMKSSFVGSSSKPRTGVVEEANACMAQAREISYGAYNDNSDRLAASISCFNKHFSKIKNSADCIALARQIHYGAHNDNSDRLAADKQCFNRFNK